MKGRPRVDQTDPGPPARSRSQASTAPATWRIGPRRVCSAQGGRQRVAVADARGEPPRGGTAGGQVRGQRVEAFRVAGKQGDLVPLTEPAGDGGAETGAGPHGAMVVSCVPGPCGRQRGAVGGR
ncbi:hypothetical protein [Modestobacter marinus]|uniref:hypothetical protein n=1 Tax=Modestobacter marinus TaxID=477641 RepID=UPI001C98DD70|nr:hypothetical protein [Modestobacter marinus]